MKGGEGDITEALWGTRVSGSTVSELNQKIYARIEAWRTRPIENEHAYVNLDGIWLKRSWGKKIKNVAVLVAIGVNQQGDREVLRVAEGAKEDSESWTGFLRQLKERGLRGVRLFISDKCLGLVGNLAEFYPEAGWQRVRGALLPQRVDSGAQGQGAGGGGDAEGGACTGGPVRGPRQGGPGDRQAARDALGGRR